MATQMKVERMLSYWMRFGQLTHYIEKTRTGSLINISYRTGK